MLSQQDIINKLQREYSYLKNEYGVKKIGIFGSYGKGNPTANSDIDLIVEFEQPIGFQFMELVEYLENLFGKKVDVLTPAGLQNIRLNSVNQDISQNIIYV